VPDVTCSGEVGTGVIVPKLGFVCGSRRHPCHPWTAQHHSVQALRVSLAPLTHTSPSPVTILSAPARRRLHRAWTANGPLVTPTDRRSVNPRPMHRSVGPRCGGRTLADSSPAHTCPNGTGGLLVTDLGRLQPLLRLPRALRQRFPLPLLRQPVRSTPSATEQHARQWTSTNPMARRRPGLPPTYIICLYRPHKRRCRAVRR
jgi:hypothetical protein